MAKEIRLLKADEIECRVGTINDKGFSILLYKDARVDMNILDETFGSMNWQREHKEIKGNLYCGISVWDDEKQQWITKWDCGIESIGNDGNEKKGESSDAFKRAGFNVGIGRELYTAPFIWINDNVVKNANGKLEPTKEMKNLKVAEIEYNDKKEINRLVIINKVGAVFEYGTRKYDKEIKNNVIKTEDIKKEMVDADEKQTTKSKSKKTSVSLDDAKQCLTPKGAMLGDLNKNQLTIIANNPKYDEHIRECAKIILADLEKYVIDDNGEILF